VTRHTLSQRMVHAWLAFALVAAAGVSGLAFAGPAEAASTVAVSLKTMSPQVATSGSEELSLTGNLTVPSGQSHDDVIVQFAYEQVPYRSNMSEGPDGDFKDIEPPSLQDSLGTVSAGTHVWTLKTPLSALNLTAGNVYAIDVLAYSNGERLGAMRTYLPYDISSASASTTQLTVLAPVTAASPLDGYQETISGAQYSEVTEDTVGQDMSTGGSLYKLLEDSAKAPQGMISWAVDPDLLATAKQLENGYIIAKSSAASDDTGSYGTDAAAWLAKAGTVLGSPGSELWQLPSTDPDLGSLSTASSSQSAEVKQLLSTAADQAASGTDVKSVAGRDPQGLLAWPADGQVSGQTLSLAESIDPKAVVVDSASIGLTTANDSYTPTGRASAAGDANLVVGDTSLDAIMSGDSADGTYNSAGSDSTLLAGQRLLAQTALISMESPTLARTVMITLPREAATSDADMGILAGLKSASWVKPVGLSTLLKQSPDANASTGTPSRSSSVTATDLTTDQLDKALTLESQLQLFRSILTKPDDTTTTDFAEAVLRTVSTGWRGDTSAWTGFESTVSSRLTSQTNLVYLIPKSSLTLSGTNGSIPFSVVNHLQQAVNLGLAVETSKRTSLHLSQIPVREFKTGTTTVEVKVTVVSAPGSDNLVTAYLVNSVGQHYGSAESGGSQSLHVTVTSIGFVALLLFAGSAALLVFAVGLRIYRGRKGSRSQLETHAGD